MTSELNGFRILDLFCGAGGLSWGMHKNPYFKTMVALDFDEKAATTFEKNMPDTEVMVGDITDASVKEKIVTLAKKTSVNMIVGGPPCQGYSMKGKKLGLDDSRNFLFREYLDLVERLQNDLQKSGFDLDKNEYIEALTNVSVLILDDLGIERDTSYAKEQVYNIVNSRYLKQKPTIFTTNLPYEKIQNSDDGVEYERIYSRIIEMCIPVKVMGEDFRKRLQKEKLKQNKERLLKGGERTLLTKKFQAKP